ncbi:MAG: LytS/YhcK type 5TM receptor domain-containing protein [Veillonellales bacterium]
MQESLSMILLQRIAFIAVIAYVFSQTRAFRSLFKEQITSREQVILVIAFSGISIAGTYFGIPVGDALANVRDTGSIVAGLLGGPLVGTVTGLISGLHRISLGGFTAVQCGVVTILGGVISGCIHQRMKPKTPDFITGILIGISIILLSMILILFFAEPHAAAVSLVYQITIPMVLANILGIATFMIIVHNAREHQTKIGALQTNKALRIANATLPFFRQGLTIHSAGKVAAAIQTMTSAAAVAITNCDEVLSHVGLGEDHHRAGDSLLATDIRDCFSAGETIKLQHDGEIGCRHKNCPFKSSLIAPLYCQEELVGTLKIYYTSEDAMSELDIEFTQGLGQIFSTQLELAKLQHMAELTTKAELKALQAQVNPHFLFNALNTIVSLCRTNSEEARRLLVELSDFFRRSLKTARDFVTLQEELDHVDSYLILEKARFGQRLIIEKQIDENVLDTQIPCFTLQPLVENAVKHGLQAKEHGGTVRISAQRSDIHVEITICDDGVGIPPEIIQKVLVHGFGKGTGVGLSNVNERLKTIYGPQYALAIDSVVGKGTVIKLSIPMKSEGISP